MLATRTVKSSAKLTSSLLSKQVRAFAKAKEEGIKFELKEKFELHIPEGVESFTGPKSYNYATKEECEKMFYTMALIRRVESVSDQLYKQRMIRGFCHLYSGEEAICVGIDFTATRDDPIITAYREHGNAITRGDTPAQVFGELMGKYTGSSKGKGGSMHFYNKKSHFYGGNGIVGAQVPVGTGLAYSLKYGKEKAENCAFICFGDGAANQGQCFEAYNMAALWKLPCVYICENNRYGMGTAMSRAAASTKYYARGDYIPGVKVPAMNVFAVRSAIAFAKDWAINNGPIMLEMDTYRYSGHSMSDPGTTYRTREEIQKVRESMDPIEKMRNILIEKEIFTAEYLKEIEKKIREEVDQAVEEAKAAPLPPMSELYADVYTPNDIPIRGAEYPIVYNV